ncbi:hexosaminidase [Catalinimonas alkaloidigena]|uniref:beta-N-acetylhexosaminidase n=1 Tax=Catalinimonas alkaloidigena TaxID=1075417 RepID=A0A1G8XKF5_9BACT|nr:beta-N-acetylhexosaminidase [Catalinimonas alkaloidigena]SDJ90240.1 hexosaminidase [Catalinimonas alkaloidigena]
MIRTHLITRAFWSAFLLAFSVSCATQTTSEQVTTDLSQAPLIPKPASVQATHRAFLLTENSAVYYQEGHPDVKAIADHLAQQLQSLTGRAPEVRPTADAPDAGHLYLTLSADATPLGEEGYELTIAEEGIHLRANQPAGLFYGVQTLRQLLPPTREGTTPLSLATGTIRDVPTYAYRGSMLDVSRHFLGMDDVKQYLDWLASYKMNVLHLHLSDDQGWRIEIKSWPNLTAHGGSTEVGGGEGGFFTQAQYQELVDYARQRYITLVPEIDMPGHTNAALASYPELNCNGKAPELYTGTEVGFSTFCTDKDVTYQFIDDVVRELAALTPGPYLHIGGDESHVTKMEDYIPFVNKVQAIVQKHGKQVIGWDEIAHASLVPGAIVQSWANVENTTNAVRQGGRVILSPASKAYLDMQYDSTTTLGLHWAGYIEVDSAYAWDPATLMPGVGQESILGVEAPLWTETIEDLQDVEYMVFPRLPGYAEIGWTPAKLRNWDDYKARLAQHAPRWQAMDIQYYPSRLVEWPQ